VQEMKSMVAGVWMAGAALALTVTPALSAPITTPQGLSPGAQYRLAFVTSSATTAGSGAIGDYNAFVTTVANTQTALAALATTWTAIGSTATVDARDNTGTNPIGTGVPIFLLDGVSKIADNNADLWDGTIAHALNVTEAGNTLSGISVWTGTTSAGIKQTTGNARQLGNGAVIAGSSSATNSGWILANGYDNFSPNPLYAISGLLTVPNPNPDLTLTKTHSGNFAQGQTGAAYTVTVTNSGAGDKSAGNEVSVTDTPPAGQMTLTAMSGSGWTCTALPTCTRTDLLAAGGSYPPITVTVAVAEWAPTLLVNSAAVGLTGQSEDSTGNNAATDATTIAVAIRPVPALQASSLIVLALLLGLLGWHHRTRRSPR
jgi:uncharacterized repeat protein (TIGR01451 family)